MSKLTDLNPHLLILEDSTNTITFKHLKSLKYQSQFIPYPTFRKKKTSFQKNRNYWAKLSLDNQSNRNHWVLYVGNASYIELYAPDDENKYLKKVSGNLIPGNQREIKSSIVEFKYKFYLQLYSKQKTVLYIKIQGTLFKPSYSVKLVEPEAFLSQEALQKVIQSIFQGGLWIIILYNFVLFLLVKDKTYLYYVMYTLSYSLYYIMYNDLYNGLPKLQIYTSMISSQVSMLFYFQFMRLFVGARQLISKWDKVIYTWIVLKSSVLLISVVYLNISFNTSFLEIYMVSNFYIDAILFLITIVVLLISNSILARYFVTGSFFLMLGWILSTISFSDLVHVDFNKNYFSQAGLFLELVLFSVGLGYRERKNEQDKRLAQEENARILREQNVTLERKVKERTKEITEKNEELQLQKEEILTQRDSLQERGEELQFAYNQITDSVRYAQTIQNAILPFEPKIKQIFEEYFIIYQPKDIVSGDFYWFNTIKGENFTKTVVAVIDCTGHGVPGAFMSMIGNTLLNETINEKHIFDPAKVITLLHQKIRSDLRQAETNNSDGMDMSLCVIEPLTAQQFKVTFSGAKRPLYYVQEGEFNQLKADRFSIGGEVYEDERARVFTNQELILAKGDALYMMTDGFGDTPDAERRRFGSRNIKKMISHYAHLSMKEQQVAFEATLAKHQGSQDARDDVTMLGLRL
ncbi:7TM diverse intracellular signaling domain-containing protein [uncultured Microscilla sp.]|uniref:7TM diverse intracellular signaling domain-containing protein n=1 Tax=uncultured Microscilla sp. TaxID=432653 RepID=UPI00260DDFFC|nr:7TM diverse intracellular signaling domain-containing protein [uncultured Microscilla sp.]